MEHEPLHLVASGSLCRGLAVAKRLDGDWETACAFDMAGTRPLPCLYGCPPPDPHHRCAPLPNTAGSPHEGIAHFYFPLDHRRRQRRAMVDARRRSTGSDDGTCDGGPNLSSVGIGGRGGVVFGEWGVRVSGGGQFGVWWWAVGAWEVM